MFNYDVLSEQEAMQERFQLLKEGEYDAVIDSSVDKVSANSGNPMMEIMLKVFDQNGKEHTVKDFLVFTKGMMWKVVHFADSSGLVKEYESKQLCSDVAIGKRVCVKIGIEEGGIISEDKLKGKAPGSKYPDKNKVEDYIKKDKTNSTNNSQEPNNDDEIPF